MRRPSSWCKCASTSLVISTRPSVAEIEPRRSCLRPRGRLTKPSTRRAAIDIEASTRLLGELGATYAQLLDQHNRSSSRCSRGTTVWCSARQPKLQLDVVRVTEHDDHTDKRRRHPIGGTAPSPSPSSPSQSEPNPHTRHPSTATTVWRRSPCADRTAGGRTPWR